MYLLIHLKIINPASAFSLWHCRMSRSLWKSLHTHERMRVAKANYRFAQCSSENQLNLSNSLKSSHRTPDCTLKTTVMTELLFKRTF